MTKEECKLYLLESARLERDKIIKKYNIKKKNRLKKKNRIKIANMWIEYALNLMKNLADFSEKINNESLKKEG